MTDSMLQTNTPLKKARFYSGLTQTALARKTGLSQSTIQRYESGPPSGIPEDVVKKLAAALKCTPEKITGHVDSLAMLSLQTTGDSDHDNVYFGEVAIHFAGPGRPLLAPVTVSQANHILSTMQKSADLEYGMLSFRTVDNRYLLLRRRAIADLYLSSDDANHYGPEGSSLDDYPDYIDVASDDAFWNLIAEFDMTDDKELAEHFGKDRVEQARKVLNRSGQQNDEGNHERERIAELIVERAHAIVWQLSTGQRRAVTIYEDEHLYETFMPIFPDLMEVEPFICLRADEDTQTILINTGAIDYLSVPAEKYERIALRLLDDESNRAAAKTVTKAPKKSRKKH